jgi:branched-chain amino acid transport system substrate-binding protein
MLALEFVCEGPAIVGLDSSQPMPRLFKYLNSKLGGVSMTRKGPRLGVLAAFLVAVAACGGSTGTTAQTDVGITSNSILLGNTIALSGPAAAYGTIANAENAYFTYINNTKGGVNGRKITFKILDDAYTPANAVTLTKQLVEQDQVFAMFSGLGTQTQTSVRDYLNTQKVPQLFVATGATTFMADYSQHNWTIGWQPPYQGEARIYAKDVLANHPNAKIGVLYQNDDYGQDYLKGLTDGLGSNASMIVDKESYDVTAASTASQLATLKAKGADTLFLFTTPAFTIKSLVITTALHWAPTIYLNSVSNPQVYMGIAKRAGAALQNVTSVGYIKDPTDPQWTSDAGMQLYKTVIANCTTCNVLDGFNIYGVAVAYSMVDVLTRAGSNMTRKNVMDIAANQLNETNPFLLPGVNVKTTSSDHFPITQEQVITWNGTGWSLQGSLIDERGTIK